MDDLNKRLQQATRAQARTQQAKLEQKLAEREAAAPEDDEPRRAPPAGAGRLVLERRQGEWRYYLGEHRVRVGDALELYVNDAVGWVRGTFQWGRRNTSPPMLRVRVVHPDDPASFLGELEIGPPSDAIFRWPT